MNTAQLIEQAMLEHPPEKVAEICASLGEIEWAILSEISEGNGLRWVATLTERFGMQMLTSNLGQFWQLQLVDRHCPPSFNAAAKGTIARQANFLTPLGLLVYSTKEMDGNSI